VVRAVGLKGAKVRRGVCRRGAWGWWALRGLLSHREEKVVQRSALALGQLAFAGQLRSCGWRRGRALRPLRVKGGHVVTGPG